MLILEQIQLVFISQLQSKIQIVYIILSRRVFALYDPLLDPFINPAKGGSLSHSQLVFAPITYKISGNESFSKTLPLTVMLNNNQWYFNSSLSIQELNLARAGSQRNSIQSSKLKNSYIYGFLWPTIRFRSNLSGSRIILG